jgi:hypothetical protein
MLKALQKGMEAIAAEEGVTTDDQVVERVTRLAHGIRAALTAGNEAIEQVETAARKKRDELAEKQLAKNYQSRKGGLMTAKAGRDLWDAREVKEQSAAQRKAAKMAKEAEKEEAEQAKAAAEAAKQAWIEDRMLLREFYDDGDEVDPQHHRQDGQDRQDHRKADYDDYVRSSPPPLIKLSQEVQDFNREVAEAGASHQRRHDLHHGITKASDWGLAD